MRLCLWLVPLTVAMGGRRDHVTENQNFSFKQKSKNSQNWSLHFWKRFSKDQKIREQSFSSSRWSASLQEGRDGGGQSSTQLQSHFHSPADLVVLTLLKLLTLLAIWRAQKKILCGERQTAMPLGREAKILNFEHLRSRLGMTWQSIAQGFFICMHRSNIQWCNTWKNYYKIKCSNPVERLASKCIWKHLFQFLFMTSKWVHVRFKGNSLASPGKRVMGSITEYESWETLSCCGVGHSFNTRETEGGKPHSKPARIPERTGSAPFSGIFQKTLLWLW